MKIQIGTNILIDYISLRNVFPCFSSFYTSNKRLGNSVNLRYSCLCHSVYQKLSNFFYFTLIKFCIPTKLSFAISVLLYAVSSVFKGSSYKKMFRVKTRRIVTRMTGKKFSFNVQSFIKPRTNSIYSVVSPINPKHSIPTLPTLSPLPASRFGNISIFQKNTSQLLDSTKRKKIVFCLKGSISFLSLVMFCAKSTLASANSFAIVSIAKDNLSRIFFTNKFIKRFLMPLSKIVCGTQTSAGILPITPLHSAQPLMYRLFTHVNNEYITPLYRKMQRCFVLSFA